MLVQNQLDLIPGENPSEKPRFSYADITTHLFLVIELLRSFKVGIERAENVSVAQPSCFDIIHRFRNPTIHLTVALRQGRKSSLVTLEVTLTLISRADPRNGLGALELSYDDQGWRALACPHPNAERREEFTRLATSIGTFSYPEAIRKGCEPFISDEQAKNIVTRFIEVFKSG